MIFKFKTAAGMNMRQNSPAARLPQRGCHYAFTPMNWIWRGYLNSPLQFLDRRISSESNLSAGA